MISGDKWCVLVGGGYTSFFEVLQNTILLPKVDYKVPVMCVSKVVLIF